MSLESVLLLIQKYKEDDVVTKYSHNIASYLSNKGIRTHLVCYGEEGREKKLKDLWLHEVPFKLHGDNFFSWSMLIQTEFVRKVKEILDKNNISLIHANDWSTVSSGILSSKLFETPLIVTYHSLEEERGKDKPHSEHISELEWEGAYESSYVIIHKKETAEAIKVFDLPEGKVKLLNGDEWRKNLFEIYSQVVNVLSGKEGVNKNDENFNAYLGVSPS